MFGGFAPGLTHLAATRGRLFVPRRSSPRTRVRIPAAGHCVFPPARRDHPLPGQRFGAGPGYRTGSEGQDEPGALSHRHCAGTGGRGPGQCPGLLRFRGLRRRLGALADSRPPDRTEHHRRNSATRSLAGGGRHRTWPPERAPPRITARSLKQRHCGLCPAVRGSPCIRPGTRSHRPVTGTTPIAGG
ncbi:hypothetical protein [Paeniglutamicibacter cryotolerans]|uniref:hypothetical protein n=1 Tax=Paeniglutamicibacter cryotolerans TaxID=670079 RepID=UPI0031EB3FBC